jgi:MYXO-CTERM domain-containing protein
VGAFEHYSGPIDWPDAGADDPPGDSDAGAGGDDPPGIGPDAGAGDDPPSQDGDGGGFSANGDVTGGGCGVAHSAPAAGSWLLCLLGFLLVVSRRRKRV